MKVKSSIPEIALVFFKLGLFAFGGPAAHISMMEDEVVTKRKWMSRDHYLDLIGATNLIPGPNSTEMTMHCGHERGGFVGLFVAGLSFIFPAIVTTGLLAYFFVQYGDLPNIKPFVFGIKPVVLAVIASAVVKLGEKAIKSWELILIGVVVLGLSLFGVSEVLMLLGGGVFGALYFYSKRKIQSEKKASLISLLLLNLGVSSVSGMTSVKVFFTFLKVGSILYGSGYVLFAYLQAELVDKGLMTSQQLLDAIAIGQFTPGPVLSTATFVGYQLDGFVGAIAASVGIFLPSFLFVLILNPLIPKMQKSLFLRGFLDAVNVSAVAIMMAVLFVMLKETVFPNFIFEWKACLVAVLGFVMVFGVKKINVMWVILAGAIFGYFLSFV